LNIDSYVADLERRIVQAPLISSYTITIDRKTADIAFIAGIMDLRNGVTVDFKEYIEDNGDTIQKFMYGYNVRQDADVLFRYDNSPDPKARKLSSFPNHKHTQSGEIIASAKVDLFTVIEEIEKGIEPE
jgi:hypothetical protein